MTNPEDGPQPDQSVPVGSIWRERRRAYQKRTVRVLSCDGPGGFVNIETVTTNQGVPPSRPVKTRVRYRLWTSTFEPVDARTDAVRAAFAEALAPGAVREALDKLARKYGTERIVMAAAEWAADHIEEVPDGAS